MEPAAGEEPASLFLHTMQWQFRMSWALAREVHLSHLTDDVCAWLPHPAAYTVRMQGDGTWRGDSGEPAEGEPWSVSVAWLTWHLQLWLTQAFAEFRQSMVPSEVAVFWPGTAAAVVQELDRLTADCTSLLRDVNSIGLDRPTRFPWPDPRPLHRLISWVNMEMMKNTAEIGAGVNAARLSLVR